MATSRTGTARWKNLRARLIRTRDHTCHHCGRPLDPRAPANSHNAIEIDHVLPVSVAPELQYDMANLVLSCHACNRAKGDRANVSRAHDTFDRHGMRFPAGFNIAHCKRHGNDVVATCPHSGALID